ncbi:Lrp/AsnC family transcriptional regulator [Rhodovulum sp. YNF3179]|uniref:Lrp/AsnC family transcriptional regulator n=1 Tax=Rhodovulum sp. YNF3179 TaxID=3425127 RepID=UPI003D330CE7
MQLDPQDRRLLDILQREGRISNADLAERAALSASACWRRVRALEEAGVIRRYAALIDAAEIGMGFHAIVHVQLTRHAPEAVNTFIEAVRHRAEVQDCFATAGEADYHLRVVCRDLEAYNAFLDGFLFRLPGIANVRTNMVLKQIKHEPALRLG